ncbi:hypothetical protein N7507_007806 [Penicillium longicatenatum]|nr:hypothetical protein N7507_007806 [Penicillium longicatenatum]
MQFGKLFVSLELVLLARDSLAAGCMNPIVRKEWRDLTKPERADYLSAVQCLSFLPDVTGGLENATNLYQSFQATHSRETLYIHWVIDPAEHDQGHFVLWHRYFLSTYEMYLRDSCGYKGAQP